jgi:hypothetical protein
MTKLYYPQISLEDYQIFRKFMLPGEFPEKNFQHKVKKLVTKAIKHGLDH